MKTITYDTSIYDLVKEYPEIREIMVELGFKTISQPSMLTAVGKYMTLRKGSTMKKIELSVIQEVFEKHGFTVVSE